MNEAKPNNPIPEGDGIFEGVDRPMNTLSFHVEAQLLDAEAQVKDIEITTNTDPQFYDGDKHPVLSGTVIGKDGKEYKIRIIKYPETRSGGRRFEHYKNFGTVNGESIVPKTAIKLWDRYSPPISKWGAESK